MSVKGTAVTLAFLLICSAGTAKDKGSHPSQQLHFSAEDSGVKKPVPIPESVLAILRKDEHVENVLESENIPAEEIPPSWFSASAIHLSNSGRVDLVVMGEGLLRGANVITFWVFRSTTRGYELVLTAPAHDLIVANTRSKGCRDIELVSMTAKQISMVLLRFDGKLYKEHKSTLDPIR